MSFTWFNINPEYNNQTIKYGPADGEKKDLKFPTGVWNLI